MDPEVWSTTDDFFLVLDHFCPLFRKNELANSEKTYGQMEGWTEGQTDGS